VAGFDVDRDGNGALRKAAGVDDAGGCTTRVGTEGLATTVEMLESRSAGRTPLISEALLFSRDTGRVASDGSSGDETGDTGDTIVSTGGFFTSSSP
jgi:hypothetical protein